jgi:hypothetical protein
VSEVAVHVGKEAVLAGSDGLLGFAVRHQNPGRDHGGWLQPVKEVEPREPDVVCLQQIEQRLRSLSIHGHEVIVGVVLEQFGASFEDVAVVLDTRR